MYRFRGGVVWKAIADIKNIQNDNFFREKLKLIKDTIIGRNFMMGYMLTAIRTLIICT